MTARPTPGAWIAALMLLPAARAPAQQTPDPAPVIAAQREAMQPLAALDGVWRGPAWTIGPGGTKHTFVQTERVGPLLDGSVKVIEGKSYEPDGRVGFNAFATISYDVGSKAYRFHSHAQGRVGDFVLTPTAEGFDWEIPAGPQMTIRYVTKIRNGEWREVGDRVVAGQPPVRFFEMVLKRVGDTGWPAGDAVPPK